MHLSHLQMKVLQLGYTHELGKMSPICTVPQFDMVEAAGFGGYRAEGAFQVFHASVERLFFETEHFEVLFIERDGMDVFRTVPELLDAVIDQGLSLFHAHPDYRSHSFYAIIIDFYNVSLF